MLYLVRHEETPLNAENRFRGSANPGLSERGKHAAVGLRYRLDGKFNRIICDEYARTCQTARRIAGSIPVETDNGLEPWDIGDISGTEKTPARKREFDRRYVEHPDAVPAGGESLNAFLRRWKPVYEKYLRESHSDNILLVIHGSNMGAVLSKFKPAPLQGSITQKPGTVLQVGGNGVPKFLPSKRGKMKGSSMQLSQLARA